MNLFSTVFYVPFLCLVQWVCSTAATGNGLSTVHFEITVTWEDWEVAGAVRKTILTNGQFPAPKLQLKQGDNVEFMVNNWLPFPTAIHFHGIQQHGTPWSDGVPGLSQRPIQPGHRFLYKWKAEESGSYFYHSHSRSQINDGLFGAIYIEPNDCVDKPFDTVTEDGNELQKIVVAERNTQPVLLSDWTLLTSEEVWQAEEATGLDAFCVNAMLINGKGSVQCLEQDRINELATPAMRAVLQNHTLTDMACLPPLPAVEGPFPHNLSAAPPGFYKGCEPFQGPTATFYVDPAAGYVSWDLVSAAGVSMITYSVDEHPMWVYAADGRYIQPMQVDAVTVSNGARYSVLVKLDKPSGDYIIRAANTGINQIINATAIMSYTTPHEAQDPSEPYIDITGRNATPDTVFFDEARVTPFPVEAPSMEADSMYKLRIERYNASYRWVLGESSYPQSLQTLTPPALFDRSSIPDNFSISTQNGTWVDLVFTVTPLQPPHPIHKHSNKYFVIGQGEGSFNYSSVAEAVKEIPQNFNFDTPQIRDSFPTPPAATKTSWLAIRYQVVNPGAFLLHCHIQMHLAGGMALALLDGVDEWPTVPPEYLYAGWNVG